MHKPKVYFFHDAWVMIKRSMLISMRNPEMMAMSVAVPAFLMFMFGSVFGNIADIGDYSYIDFIVPGIILQSVAQANQFTAINVTTDMTRGIIDRFRSMPIAKSAVLIGHAAASVLRNAVTTAVIIGTALLMGFRPQGGLVDWLMAVGILLLTVIAISWFAVFAGLLAKAPESASGFMFPLFILPFLSSGFAPADTLPRWLQAFARHQPMTPIIDSTRNLMMNFPSDNSLWIAIVWCAGITVVAYVGALWVFKRKAV